MDNDKLQQIEYTFRQLVYNLPVNALRVDFNELWEVAVKAENFISVKRGQQKIKEIQKELEADKLSEVDE